MRAFIVAAQAVSMSSRMCIKLAYVNVEARIRTCARLVRFWYPRERGKSIRMRRISCADTAKKCCILHFRAL